MAFVRYHVTGNSPIFSKVAPTSTTVTATEITYKYLAGSAEYTFTGAFKTSAQGDVSGTLKGFSILQNGNTEKVTVIGIKADAGDFFDALDAGKADKAASIALAGDDIMRAGTGGYDTIKGFGGSDWIYSGTGNDTVQGGAGDDFLFGEGGNDRVFGNQGNDLLRGGFGRDKLFGGQGNDILHGDSRNDFVFGGKGNDTLFGDQGDDKLHGGRGRDILKGGDGDDALYGDGLVIGPVPGGPDRLFGGAGDDFIHGGPGKDIMFGGAGKDIFEWDIAQRGDGDVIKDFDVTQDKLSLDTHTFRGHLKARTSDGDTFVSFAGLDIVRLEGVTLSLSQIDVDLL